MRVDEALRHLWLVRAGDFDDDVPNDVDDGLEDPAAGDFEDPDDDIDFGDEDDPDDDEDPDDDDDLLQPDYDVDDPEDDQPEGELDPDDWAGPQRDVDGQLYCPLCGSTEHNEPEDGDCPDVEVRARRPLDGRMEYR
jgi:hypothetical protein